MRDELRFRRRSDLALRYPSWTGWAPVWNGLPSRGDGEMSPGGNDRVHLPGRRRQRGDLKGHNAGQVKCNALSCPTRHPSALVVADRLASFLLHPLPLDRVHELMMADPAHARLMAPMTAHQWQCFRADDGIRRTLMLEQNWSVVIQFGRRVYATASSGITTQLGHRGMGCGNP